jgi:hypothetical protein
VALEVSTQTVVLSAKDKKVRAHLLQCSLDDLLMQVAKKKTGKEMWDCLKSRFFWADHVKEAWLQTLKSEFDALKMKDDEGLDHYTRKLTGMSVKYSNLGGLLDDVAMVVTPQSPNDSDPLCTLNEPHLHHHTYASSSLRVKGLTQGW